MDAVSFVEEIFYSNLWPSVSGHRLVGTEYIFFPGAVLKLQIKKS